MKKHQYWLIIIMAGVLFFGGYTKRVSAHVPSQNQAMILSASSLQADQTPIPTVSASQVAMDTPESRELPPVGSNAGMVIGASVLVLIIIGGVLGSRRREKH